MHFAGPVLPWLNYDSLFWHHKIMDQLFIWVGENKLTLLDDFYSRPSHEPNANTLTHTGEIKIMWTVFWKFYFSSNHKHFRHRLQKRHNTKIVNDFLFVEENFQ
jgi:hypothetical protein